MIYLLILVFFIFTKPGRKITGWVFNKILESSLKIIIFIALAVLCIWIGYTVIVWAITHIFLTLCIIAGFIVLGYFLDKKDRKKHEEIVQKWKNRKDQIFTDVDIFKALSPHSEFFYNSCNNSVKFKDNFPWGRVRFFLNFFDHDTENEEVLFFAPVRTTNSEEIREYGLLLTTAGLYVSIQQEGIDNDKTSKCKNINLMFSGMVASDFNKSSLTVKYVNYDDTITLKQEYVSVPLEEINNICQKVISSGISRAIYNEKVMDYVSFLDEKEEEFLKKDSSQKVAEGFSAAGIGASLPQMQNLYDSVKHNMDQGQGHGVAAEYAGTVVDRFKGDFTAKMIGGDNAKDGADRISHGVRLQCKFCKSASDTLRSAFSDDHNYDFSKMKVEVPRDQYAECVTKLQKKIDNGDLVHKGIKPGEKAEKYLRKSPINYLQSHHIAMSGSIESIVVDTLGGITCSAAAGSITALLTFANCVWNGVEPKEAAKTSLIIGAKTIGKATAVYVATMQISRKNFIDKSVIKGFTEKGKIIYGSKENWFYTKSNNLAEIINKKVVGSNFGKKIGLKKTSGQKIVSGTVVFAVTFGPDICRALVGRISVKQLLKNSAVGAAGIGGAAVGQTVIPIPIVGAMIGGAVASFVAKKTLDQFIEDDAVEMYHILREEFIDTVMTAGLTKSEFEQVVNITICNKKMPHILRDMYAYGDAREYAREKIMNVAITDTYSKRKVITENEFDSAMALLTE